MVQNLSGSCKNIVNKERSVRTCKAGFIGVAAIVVCKGEKEDELAVIL